jgi:methylmalonyl-CoA/ethylmalonyl-CoA epimerase
MNTTAVKQALGALVTGIDHISVAVRDLEASIRWYSEVLGFEVKEQRTTQGDRSSMRSAVMVCGGAMVVLVEGGEPSSQVTRFIEQRGEGVSHVALAVTDLDEALLRVEAVAGRIALPPVEERGIRQVFLESEGSSGVRIELIERRGGAFSDHSVREMYRALEAGDRI